MNADSRIYVAGSRGLLGSAIVRRLFAQGHRFISGFRSSEFDLTNREHVHQLFDWVKPEYVFMAAARVGGVCSNESHEAEFLLHNLQIQNNVISAAHAFGVKKLLFMGSACVYPRLAPEPVKESSLLTGALEPSNEWYALAKIAGLKLCQAYWKQYGSCFISCMPTNLYGPGDKYDLQSSHVLPALIRKIHEAKLRRESVVCWGTGAPTREFLYSDDCADACIELMNNYNSPEPVNIGGCSAISIAGLAARIAEVVGFTGSIEWDATKPDGTPRRSIDGSKLAALGWRPKVGLVEGLKATYADFLEQQLEKHAALYYDNHR